MVKIALFRRRPPRASTAIKGLDTTGPDFTEESTVSSETVTLSTSMRSSSSSLPNTSSRWDRRSVNNNKNSNKKKKKGVRFQARPKVYAHYTRFDDDIHHGSLWWTPEELQRLLKLEMKGMVTKEDIEARQYPQAVRDWAEAAHCFYQHHHQQTHHPQDEHDDDDDDQPLHEQGFQAAMDATLEWRGLEEYMVDHRHGDRLEDHLSVVLKAVRPRKRCTALPVVPPASSVAAAALAVARARHDAQQAGGEDDHRTKEG